MQFDFAKTIANINKQHLESLNLMNSQLQETKTVKEQLSRPVSLKNHHLATSSLAHHSCKDIDETKLKNTKVVSLSGGTVAIITA